MNEIALVSAKGLRSGLGHAKRSQRLRVALLEKTRKISVRELSVGDESNGAFSSIDLKGAQVVVFDLPPHLWSEDLFELIFQLQSNSQRTVGIDGPFMYLDLLLLSTFHVNALRIELARQVGVHAIWGWDYLMIDQRVGLSRQANNNSVLVLTGGSDSMALSQTLPALLDQALPLGTEINWVLGPFAQAPQLSQSRRLRWRVHRGVDDLRPLFEASGFALTVYGITVFELLHHGVPSVVFSPYGDRDLEHLEILDKEGLVVKASSPSDAVSRLRDLMNDEDLAETLSTRGASRVPASGTASVAEKILDLI